MKEKIKEILDKLREQIDLAEEELNTDIMYIDTLESAFKDCIKKLDNLIEE